ncbi:acetyltransferase, GNAT family [Marvinbryantia formatexigens DSM 14469]|uniref:Acetyltransferase, GNAT family n=1 Tax=Marvinbryantia formatexigens DSM 14469 TaxID=478749 RepID=C6LL37_9FIRM|nr:GNAT family N-acetyltransferase [Marvinbryantia formatexigens]EET58656.1 acetyltransferase, GNAT family [Marvinbryantia formatexigens DSM 14469]UWO23378.1 GNAT family N-acetyltransferase [Marvinbryantia formatexigens DSM 14469]SDG39383.1 Protein N-acetyltransferase, RimJ/RimL family [Marvinbryantia formatexigens]
MLISLREIADEEACRAALAVPIRMEEHAVYVTRLPEAARALAKKKLPCIFLESAGQRESVWGVDLVLMEEPSCPPEADDARREARTEQGGTDAGADINLNGMTGNVCTCMSWRTDDICGQVARHLGDEALMRLWQRHYGLPWTIAQTERLLIRESVMEDLPAFLSMYGEEADNPDVTPFPDNPEEIFYSYVKHQYPLCGYGLWTVVERKSGAVAGRIGVEDDETGGWQMAYLIARRFRRRGYAKEAAAAVLAYARDVLQLPQLKLHTSAGNTASQKLAAGLGFSGNSYTVHSDDCEQRWDFFTIDLTDR